MQVGWLRAWQEWVGVWQVWVGWLWAWQEWMGVWQVGVGGSRQLEAG